MRLIAVLAGLCVSGVVSAAQCYVTEFRERPPVTYQGAIMPALVNQNITYTTSSVQSAVFNASTQLVRVHCDNACWVLFGTNPTATTNMTRLAAGQTEYFTVVPNSDLRLAVIGASE